MQRDITRFIDPDVFPADRDDIVESATRQCAPQEIIERLKRLPHRLYDGFADLADALHPSEGRRWTS